MLPEQQGVILKLLSEAIQAGLTQKTQHPVVHELVMGDDGPAPTENDRFSASHAGLETGERSHQAIDSEVRRESIPRDTAAEESSRGHHSLSSISMMKPKEVGEWSTAGSAQPGKPLFLLANVS